MGSGGSVLRKIFDRHGCDKGSRHGYERVYELLFEPIRLEPLRILEIGILRGASLASWVDYFPNAQVVGIDTFQRVPPEDVPILGHERVTWHKHSSFEPLDIGHFDIVIDDGLHTHAAQKATFDNFMPYAKHYFIEDVWALEHMTEEERKHKWLNRRGYSNKEYRALMDSLKPYSVEFFDLREGHQPDSFIIGVS